MEFALLGSLALDQIFLSFGSERKETLPEVGPFSAILGGFNSLSLSSVWFRKDLSTWNNLSFCLPYAGYVIPGDPRHILLLENENDSSF